MKQLCEEGTLVKRPDWFLPSFVIYPKAREEVTLSNLQLAKIASRKQKDERQLFLKSYQDMERKVWIAKSSTGAKGELFFS